MISLVMPVEIGDKTYEGHDEAVKALKRKKPGIKDPDAYVAVIERNEKGAKLKARLAKIVPLSNANETDKVKEIKSGSETYNQK